MSRQTIVAGNWKMNTNLVSAINLTKGINNALKQLNLSENKKVILCPPFPFLAAIKTIATHPNLYVGAQDCHQKQSGAFTGEVSPQMLESLGLNYVILGHSERRAYFGETDNLLKEKVLQVLKTNMSIIFCCGEQLTEREGNQHFSIVQQQLETAIFHLSANDFGRIIIAYEPVWAIGTGKTATPEQAGAMHAHIRQLIIKQYGEIVANHASILYGGSCKPHNAEALFSQPNVDGGLVGGASLKVASFMGIIEKM